MAAKEIILGTGPTSGTGGLVAVGGTTGQVYTKINSTNFNANWQNPTGGAGGALTKIYYTATGGETTIAAPNIQSAATTAVWTSTSLLVEITVGSPSFGEYKGGTDQVLLGDAASVGDTYIILMST